MANNGISAPPAAAAASGALATSAQHRILAWPRYERATDLETLTKTFAPAFRDRADVCLCLRHDPAIDIPLEQAIAAVTAEFTRTLGDNTRFEVLVVDDRLDNNDGWAALGRAVTGVILLPWSWDAQRHERLNKLGHALLTSGDELRRHLDAAPSAAAPAPVKAAPAPVRAAAPAPTATTVVAATATTPTAAPAVSVILPTYNRPEFLKRALESLAGQTFRDFEVVVVNDGGAGVESLLDTFSAQLSINYLRHGVNRGAAAARNSGMAIARGAYIAYLDDDDRYLPTHLETLVGALKGGKGPVAYSDATWVLEQKGPGGYRPVRAILTRSKPFARDQLLVANYIPLVSVMHEIGCIDATDGFDEQLGVHEDWDLLLRFASRFDFHHVPTVTAEISWREDGSSITSARPEEFSRAMPTIHQRHRALASDNHHVVATQQRLTGTHAAPAAQPAPVAPVTPVSRVGEVLRQAKASVDRGELDKAAQLLTASLDLAVESPELLLMLADIFVAQAKVKAASEILEQASLLHPRNVDISVRLTQLLAGLAARTIGAAAP